MPTNQELREQFRNMQAVELSYGTGEIAKVYSIDKKHSDMIADWWFARIAERDKALVERVEELGKSQMLILGTPSSASKFNKNASKQATRGYQKGHQDVIEIIKEPK